MQSSSYVFIVSVESANEPPQLATLGDVVAIAGQPVQIPVQVSDMDQDGLSYAMGGLPAGATITPTAVYGRALWDAFLLGAVQLIGFTCRIAIFASLATLLAPLGRYIGGNRRPGNPER